MSFELLLNKLEKDATERREDAKKEKLAQWQAIQENAPEMASFLTAMNAAFGKPKAVKVKINGVMALEHGAFDPPKNLTVPKSTTKPVRRWH
ncbi:MAG: hypothetical protein ACXW11_12370 [Methylotenera sp.]